MDRPLPDFRHGITPACAGKSAIDRGSLCTHQDHPRVCGEKVEVQLRKELLQGSPPRVRGKAPAFQRNPVRYGITPACAGKSDVRAIVCNSSRDHPRVCGEKHFRRAAGVFWAGSPPRVRGKAAAGLTFRLSPGITPACAGKSGGGFLPLPYTGDHPRVCGEKLTASKRETLCTGSPPRVRGKVKSSTTTFTGRGGSPPRVRGKGVHQVRKQGFPGITPACAGKRLKRSHRIGHFSCILCLFHSVLHRASVSGGSRAGPCAPPCLPAQNAVPV